MSDAHHHETSSDNTSKVNALQKHLTDKPLLSLVYVILVILISVALFKWAKVNVEEASENTNKEKVKMEQQVIQKISKSIVNFPLGTYIETIPPYTEMTLQSDFITESDKTVHFECNKNSLDVDMFCTGNKVTLNANTPPNTRFDLCPEMYFTNSSSKDAKLTIIVKKRNNGTIQ